VKYELVKNDPCGSHLLPVFVEAICI